MAFAKAVIDVVESKHAGPHEKYYRIEELVHDFDGVSDEDQSRLNELEDYLTKAGRNQSYYDLMEKNGSKLKKRVMGIIRFLEFDQEASEACFIDAINYLLQHDFEVFDDAPIEFLDKTELAVIYRDDALIPELYTSMLFFHMTKAIKGGRLNLKNSYEYRAIQH